MFSDSTSESASTVLSVDNKQLKAIAQTRVRHRRRGSAVDETTDSNRRTVSSAGNHRPSGAEISQHGLLPFNLVALPEFRQLVTGLQPGSTVISRDTVRKRVAEGVVGMKKTLCSLVSHDRLGVNDD